MFGDARFDSFENLPEAADGKSFYTDNIITKQTYCF
jgi:hypothetical protein